MAQACAAPPAGLGGLGRRLCMRALRPLDTFRWPCSPPPPHSALSPCLPFHPQNDYLTSRIKVVKGGKTGQVGGQVTVNNDGNIVTVATRTQFAKRYIKYLTKKFLKKNQLRDYVRVTASRSGSYQLSYFSMQKQGEEASE